MRKIITICIIGLFALNVQAQPVKTLKLSDKELLDKIKGGWAGQTIGVVFGAPTEFKFTGTYIPADPLGGRLRKILVGKETRIVR